jgi:hypothetical protein
MPAQARGLRPALRAGFRKPSGEEAAVSAPGVGALLLLGVLIYGMVQYKSRNRRNDRVTEEAAKRLLDAPARYTENTRAELEKDVRPS